MENAQATKIVSTFAIIYLLGRSGMVFRVVAGVVIVVLLLVVGCATPKQSIQYGKNERTKIQTYNIMLVPQGDSLQELRDECGGGEILRAITTDTKPRLILSKRIVAGYTTTDTLVLIETMPCGTFNTRKSYKVPIGRIAGRVFSTLSDPLEGPQQFPITEVIPGNECCRNRSGALGFDKVELRLGVGGRFGSDSVSYPVVDAGGQPIAPFQELYRSSLFGFGRGGSNIVPSLEASGLFSLNATGSWHLGPMVGLMPTDGSLFIPVAAHLRYTAFPTPPIEDADPSCNTPYVFALAGLPFDVQTGAPIIGSSMARQRVFMGAGVGYDWTLNCDVDLSIDLGVRYMNLPLPEIDCCPNIDSDDRFPFRESTMLMVRVGLTW
jgi:hypothetical protein